MPRVEHHHVRAARRIDVPPQQALGVPLHPERRLQLRLGGVAQVDHVVQVEAQPAGHEALERLRIVVRVRHLRHPLVRVLLVPHDHRHAQLVSRCRCRTGQRQRQKRRTGRARQPRPVHSRIRPLAASRSPALCHCRHCMEGLEAFLAAARPSVPLCTVEARFHPQHPVREVRWPRVLSVGSGSSMVGESAPPQPA